MKPHTLHGIFIYFLMICVSSEGKADGPADNQIESVRPVPPPGIVITAEDRKQLESELGILNGKIAQLNALKDVTAREYLPDVEIFARAVSIALTEDGFFEPRDVERAKEVLAEGTKRAVELQLKNPYWLKRSQLDATGRPRPVTTVRGYRSKLDGTVLPYGVVNRALPDDEFVRADIWCRGRSEKGLELQFIASRMTIPDPMPAPGVIMIHPFGRYCNANKLAGEVDTLEVLEHALQQYPIDPKRVAIRGFSMGGAAAWHLAVHYPDKWFAANPGAGFSETPQFLKVFQSEDVKPTWYEQKLWQLYDCPVWVRNLRMVPTIAYSGEIDRQKQAADVMAKAAWDLPSPIRFELAHIIAPRTAHKVDPIARVEIEKRLATIDRIRSDQPTRSIHFTTTTLKYNKIDWLTIHRLGEHWKPAHISASVDRSIRLSAVNVMDLSVELAADEFRDIRYLLVSRDVKEINYRGGPPPVNLDDSEFQSFDLHRRSDGTCGIRLRRQGNQWELVSPIEPASTELVKKHDLQGPIDDAFMGPFLFVAPSGPGYNPKVDQWVESEFRRGVREWHRQMRGDVRVKTSEELKPDDFENYHLILWGDAKSNPTLAKIAKQLPIQWSSDAVVVGDNKYDAKLHAPVLIYPNPLNPTKYVVVNSSVTYREYDYLNNARQIPKLPDWAIVDISTPPNAQWPGKIVDANFFGERWELKK